MRRQHLYLGAIMKLSTLIAELSVVIGAGYLLGYKAGKLQGQVESRNDFVEMIRKAKEEVMSEKDE